MDVGPADDFEFPFLGLADSRATLDPIAGVDIEHVADLADGGVMVLPLGPHGGPQQLVKLTKGEQGIKREGLIGVRFVPLLPGKAREL